MLIECIVLSEESPSLIDNYAFSEKNLPGKEVCEREDAHTHKNRASRPLTAPYPTHDHFLQAMRDMLEDSASQRNFISALRGSPADGMRGTLAIIRDDYGSVMNYLDAAGFGEDKRVRLRAVFSKGRQLQWSSTTARIGGSAGE